MASSYRWASIAVSPSCSSFLNERCLKSDRKCYVSDDAYQDARSLTKSPFRVLTVQVHLSSQFSRHLMKTLDRIRYAVYGFEAFAYDPVDRDPGKCELQTIRLSFPRGVPEKMRYSRWQRQPRHPSTCHTPMLLLPTLVMLVRLWVDCATKNGA